MSYDFYVELFVRDKEKIEGKIKEYRDRITRREEWMEQNLSSFFREKLEVKNLYSIVKEASLFEKYYEGENDDRKEDIKAGYKGFIKNINAFTGCDEDLESLSVFKEPKIDMEILPSYSILISITFVLKKSYISQDAENFYIIDNPICKDKVFKVPYIRPSSLKGALRHAAVRGAFKDFDDLSDEDKINRRLILFRLFGDEKDNVKEYLDELFRKGLKDRFEEELRKYYEKRKDQEINVRGRLIFYPTFLNQIGLDVIAPHSRETRTPVRGPILFETSPERTEGTFSLLYFPFDLIGKDEERCKREVREDLEIIRESVKGLLSEYGFSAKRTSGYGVIEDHFEEGLLKTNFAGDKTFANWGEYYSVLDEVIKIFNERGE